MGVMPNPLPIPSEPEATRRAGPPSTLPAVVAATAIDAPGLVAVQEAEAWADRTAAPLIVVHAAAPSLLPVVPPIAPALALVAPDPEARLEEHVATVTKREDVELRVLTDSSPRAVGDFVQHMAVTPRLVVVGESDASDLRRLFVGGDTQDILRGVPCDLLVARPGPETGPVLAAVELDGDLQPALHTAAAEATRRGSGLVALHVVDLGNTLAAALAPTAAVDAASGEAYEAAAEQALGAQLASLGRDGGVLLRRGRPAATIVDVATEIGASLVVVGRHRMNALERIVLGSTAEEVAAHAPCSVLLVQPPGELPSP